MSFLPPPSNNQPYCDISVLEGGYVQIPLQWVLSNAKEGETSTLPALSFLLRHSTDNNNDDTMLVDLGIRKDWQNLPQPLLSRFEKIGFVIDVPQDVPTSLRKGGIDPASGIKHVLLTHVHFDHYGDTKPFEGATFVVGSEGAKIAASGWPTDPKGVTPTNLLPEGRTIFLSPHSSDSDSSTPRRQWEPIGPFPHALDWYGDGSLYIIDAPGHLPGHINVLVRTSPTGGWCYLAGDTAHDYRLITGEAKIADTELLGCAHRDKEAAEKHMQRVRELKGRGGERVRVLLAHDVPWYETSKGGPAFLPGKLESL